MSRHDDIEAVLAGESAGAIVCGELVCPDCVVHTDDGDWSPDCAPLYAETET